MGRVSSAKCKNIECFRRFASSRIKRPKCGRDRSSKVLRRAMYAPAPQAQKPSRVNRLLSEQPVSVSLPIQPYALCSPMLPYAPHYSANALPHPASRVNHAVTWPTFGHPRAPSTRRTRRPRDPTKPRRSQWARSSPACKGSRAEAFRLPCSPVKFFTRGFVRKA